MDITRVNHNCILLNHKAYVVDTTSVLQLFELVEELKNVDSEYEKVFQFEALYQFYVDSGMTATIVSILKQLRVGNSCIISVGTSGMKITKLTESYCIGEWTSFQEQSGNLDT